MTKMTDEELDLVIAQKENFSEMYIDAAVEEIQLRKNPPKPSTPSVTIENGEKIRRIELNKEQVKNLVQKKQIRLVPSLYSKVSIAVASLIIHPLLGIILFTSNLRYAGKREGMNMTWILVLGYIVAANLMTLALKHWFPVAEDALMQFSMNEAAESVMNGNIGAISPLIPAAIGGFLLNVVITILLVKVFWEKFLGKKFIYQKKSAWGTVIIYMLILVLSFQLFGFGIL
ncbi:hypothetical protein [Persicobacter sp. CCB-QB2]|uniref:hypothetical protein n=1 Tax=Persicobacter sp. CCB-QB2 TaxID=1561025 RepID=UPI0012F9EC3E|nr:hypothetical protein [Persicobacter sp. CCB-QB2]